MGKGQSPTADELKFVYDLLAQGYSDTDIIRKYEELHRHGKLGTVKFRQDVRFIRQRRKEFEAARAVLEGYIKKLENPLIMDAKKKHFDQLAEIANALLPKQDVSIEPNTSGGQFEYWLTERGAGLGITREQLSDMLGSTVDLIDMQYNAYDLSCFLSHLEVEYPDIRAKGLQSVIRDNPYELIQTLNALARKKMFAGTCPVCKDWQ